MARLTVEQAARDAGSGATALDLSHRTFSDVSCLGSFKSLERLDLGYNCLVTLEGLSSCVNLKWLSVIENKLVSLKGVEGLTKLQVLNAGKNKLTKIDEVKSLTTLGALILNDNNISAICKLDRHHQLNTLVLSKNPVGTIGDSLVNAKSLKKLSMSHCQIEDIGSSLVACVELKELRLAHNKISKIPSDLAKNVKILNLDLGNNLIERVSDLKALAELRFLRNLNLQGNPIAEKDSLVKKVMKTVPTLRIFNAKPIEASSQTDNSRKESMQNKDEGMPDHDTIEPNTKRKDKTKQSKQLKGSEEPTAQNTRPDVTIASPIKSGQLDGKKKKKDKVVMDMEQGKSSKLKSKDDTPSLDDADRKAKEVKRKKSAVKEDKDMDGIDDTEVSFAELMFSREAGGPEPEFKDKIQGTAQDRKFVGGLVIDHTKKRKKSKGTVLDASDLKLLCSVPEVGAGGLSGWD
ncbi:protein phosphatase 1 regulatory subunit SDS22 [Brachypodium distachyon]|uniref:Protein phosphatase 1 regulatory subunit 7 n=1 Tax=Brachypodium distachyon TaxID=15368 RepID=I1HVI8_BRADI|nr:protein phosphatase 1 regulatory subunit SDS22 [Brachypodium distachyon]KQK11709.1 hypothetical protein BRADI_2g61810v3 [Brachypodium distachyon]|eukprot:XP_003565144.1 protein phosphatase 1 regulatory subunit SDS22 [Brachypodium distachyon]